MELVADGNVIRSLNRSELRRKVLFYLLSIYPYRSYLSEISRAVRSDPSNVKGCLEGLGVRYTGEESLVGLGLVVVEQSKNGFRYFKVNPDLIEDIKALKTMFNNRKVFAVEIG
ncbi:transcriptional regulator [Thermogymnomonas acidicola]|uniref:Transcriptional regulator n=1 Tax=Thermogymnomonas acidicola TaxID=399579 RepID=A0AA37BRW3_9ARCH|nr:archaellum operon transcriptional activator EarA family protein [Thermogymnomonas acidicola]GGM73887.1 transcriptional regulator [Thermogymnomonas acidicola]